MPETLRAPIVTWHEANELADELQLLGKAEREEISKLLQCWCERLSDFGGDPSNSTYDWEKFRPLRLKREEDWSDWLAELLKASKSGIFPYHLFGSPNDSRTGDWAPKDVHREEWTVGGEHRYDLKIDWSKNKYSQVEVKIWDQNFAKTYDTCVALHKEFPGQWEDYIILPESSLAAWRESEASDGKDFSFKIYSITWKQVAIALRRALWSRAELITWQAWAYAYCGAIEQQLLKIKPLKPGTKQGWWTASEDLYRCELLREGQTPTGDTNEER